MFNTNVCFKFSHLNSKRQSYYWFRCPKGHEFVTAYSTIANEGMGCPYCDGCAKKTIKDYIAVDHIHWIGETLPKNTMTKTLWKCKENSEHIWTACYNAVTTKSSGCPVCARQEGSGIVYGICCKGGVLNGKVKIGNTKQSMKARARDIKREHGISEFDVICIIPSPLRRALETHLHELLKEYHYKYNGTREFFTLPAEIIDYYLKPLSELDDVTVEIAQNLYQHVFEAVLV